MSGIRGVTLRLPRLEARLSQLPAGLRIVVDLDDHDGTTHVYEADRLNWELVQPFLGDDYWQASLREPS